MRRGRLQSVALIALALGFGLALVVVVSFRQHAVPPKMLDALMSSRIGNAVAQRWLHATAPSAPPGVRVLHIGDRLPPWSIADIHGKAQPMAQWRGKKLLINFWATWCVPCRKEMPALAAAQKRYAGTGVQVIGIAMDDPEAVRRFLQRQPAVYPMLLGNPMHPDPRVILGDTRKALPYSVLIDRDGRIAHTRLGPLDKAQLARWLQ